MYGVFAPTSIFLYNYTHMHNYLVEVMRLKLKKKCFCVVETIFHCDEYLKIN